MSLQEREKSFENKFAHDQQKLFRIEARACKMLGLWAAEQLSLSAEESDNYVQNVLEQKLSPQGFSQVKSKILKDFMAASLDITSYAVDIILERKLHLASMEIENGTAH